MYHHHNQYQHTFIPSSSQQPQHIPIHHGSTMMRNCFTPTIEQQHPYHNNNNQFNYYSSSSHHHNPHHHQQQSQQYHDYASYVDYNRQDAAAIYQQQQLLQQQQLQQQPQQFYHHSQQQLQQPQPQPQQHIPLQKPPHQPVGERPPVIHRTYPNYSQQVPPHQSTATSVSRFASSSSIRMVDQKKQQPPPPLAPPSTRLVSSSPRLVVENNNIPNSQPQRQQTPRGGILQPTASQPFSSSATFSVAAGGIRTTAPNNPPSTTFNPSQYSYGFTSTSTAATVKQRRMESSVDSDFQVPRSKLSQLRRFPTKTINQPSENEKRLTMAINEAFNLQYNSKPVASSHLRLSNLCKRVSQDEKMSSSSCYHSQQPPPLLHSQGQQQQIHTQNTQNTQTSMLQTVPIITTGSSQQQHSQTLNPTLSNVSGSTEHFSQLTKVPPTPSQIYHRLQHSQLVPQPVSVQVNVSSEAHHSHSMPPPPSNFHNTSLNSSQVSQHQQHQNQQPSLGVITNNNNNIYQSMTTVVTPPPMAVLQEATNCSQFSTHSTPSNTVYPPVILSSSFTCTPPTKQFQVSMLDSQQTHIVEGSSSALLHNNNNNGNTPDPTVVPLEPSSQLLSQSLLGGPPQIPIIPAAVPVYYHNNSSTRYHNNSQLYIPSSSTTTTIENRMIHHREDTTTTENPWGTSQPLISIPIPQVFTSLSSASRRVTTSTSFEPTLDNFHESFIQPPMAGSGTIPNNNSFYNNNPIVPLPDQHAAVSPHDISRLPSHEEIQFITIDSNKDKLMDYPTTTAHSFQAVYNEVVDKEITVLSDTKSSSTIEEEDNSDNPTSLNEKANISKIEFEKAIRNALRKARGILHDVKENGTQLLSCERDFFRYSERSHWTNRITKVRPAIFRKPRYNLQTISNTRNTGEIDKIIKDGLKRKLLPPPSSKISNDTETTTTAANPSSLSQPTNKVTTTPRAKSITPNKSTISRKQSPIPTTPLVSPIPKKTPDQLQSKLSIPITPLVSPIPKNLQKLNTIPNESDISDDFYLMKRLTTGVKNFKTLGGDDWNYEDFAAANSSSQTSPQPSEFSGLINGFM